MRFQIKKVDVDNDFSAVARCLLESYEEPKQSSFQAWMPVHGPEPADREAAIKEFSERVGPWQDQNPSSFWQKVIDTETKRVAGVASWEIYETNPFDDPQQYEISWFPDGGSRKYAEQWLQLHSLPRYKAAQKPHMFLMNLVTHPDFRRQGIAQLCMDWGMSKADELGLDIFLDATQHGKPLYEKNGFTLIEENLIAPTSEDPDKDWQVTERQIGPATFWLMRRPAK